MTIIMTASAIFVLLLENYLALVWTINAWTWMMSATEDD